MHLLLFQYQKQGKDLEKVKQRLAEIANYVDKVNQKKKHANTIYYCNVQFKARWA